MDLSKSFNMRGVEQAFEDALNDAIQTASTESFSLFQYLEIGIATGATILEVANHLSQQGFAGYAALGLDLVESPFFNAGQFIQSANAKGIKQLQIRQQRTDSSIYSEISSSGITILLNESETVIHYDDEFHFALIDGCHGSKCVARDFLSIEDAILPGGIVAFHDAGELDQGIHFQRHCQEPIAVRKALDSLKLLENGKCNRPGWRLMKVVEGDKTPKNLEQNGHGFAFFKRTE